MPSPRTGPLSVPSRTAATRAIRTTIAPPLTAAGLLATAAGLLATAAGLLATAAGLLATAAGLLATAAGLLGMKGKRACHEKDGANYG